MEKKLEGAMEQVKILNLDSGKECAEKKTLAKEEVSLGKKKVRENNKEEFEKEKELISWERAQSRRKLGKAGYIQCRYLSHVGTRMRRQGWR
jgi:hypothetical protein